MNFHFVFLIQTYFSAAPSSSSSFFFFHHHHFAKWAYTYFQFFLRFPAKWEFILGVFARTCVPAMSVCRTENLVSTAMWLWHHCSKFAERKHRAQICLKPYQIEFYFDNISFRKFFFFSIFSVVCRTHDIASVVVVLAKNTYFIIINISFGLFLSLFFIKYEQSHRNRVPRQRQRQQLQASAKGQTKSFCSMNWRLIKTERNGELTKLSDKNPCR